MTKRDIKRRIGWIDRAICAIAPKKGYERLQYREAVLRSMESFSSRGYDIGRRGRSTDGWRSSGASVNAEIGSALTISRDRSRDLVRNNAYAASAVNKLQKKIVGTGINPRIEKIADSLRSAVMSDWKAFDENCDPAGQIDYSGQESLAIRTVIESGEALVVYDPRPSDWGLRIPLQMRVLEPDYLDHTKNVALNDGGAIINGVEFDKYGRRGAYWMFDHHPGDGFMRLRGGLMSRRISAEFVDHVFDPIRPGQVRGFPWLASVALKIRDIGDYEEAEIVRKKIEACHVGFVTRQSTAASLTQEGLQKDENGRVLEQMAPGILLHGAPGEEITFNNPSGTSGVVEYLTQQLHAVAAGIGEPYFMMTGDVSQTNYSSARAAMLDFWDYLDHWQHVMMVPMMCKKTWRRFAQYRLAATGRDIDPAAQVLWSGPTRPLIDPGKDADAEKALIRMGRKTLRQSIAETGYDPDDVLAESAATNAKLDELGLTFDSDPRRVQVSGKAHADPTSQQEGTNNAKA